MEKLSYASGLSRQSTQCAHDVRASRAADAPFVAEVVKVLQARSHAPAERVLQVHHMT